MAPPSRSTSRPRRPATPRARDVSRRGRRRSPGQLEVVGPGRSPRATCAVEVGGDGARHGEQHSARRRHRRSPLIGRARRRRRAAAGQARRVARGVERARRRRRRRPIAEAPTQVAVGDERGEGRAQRARRRRPATSSPSRRRARSRGSPPTAVDTSGRPAAPASDSTIGRQSPQRRQAEDVGPVVELDQLRAVRRSHRGCTTARLVGRDRRLGHEVQLDRRRRRSSRSVRNASSRRWPPLRSRSPPTKRMRTGPPSPASRPRSVAATGRRHAGRDDGDLRRRRCRTRRRARPWPTPTT